MYEKNVNTVEQQRQKIISYVKKYIRQNHLQENDKLPSENELARLFQVNRNTVRSALTFLKAQGTIYSEKGRGFFVAQKPSPIVYKHDIFLGFSEILNQERQEYTSEVLDIRLGKPTIKERKFLNLTEDDKVYYLKQLRTKSEKHFAVGLSILPQKYVPNFEKYLDNFCGVNNILLNIYKYTHPICKHIQLTASLPDKEEMELLDISENMPILKQEGIFYVNGIGNIEYFIVRARGDSFRFSMDF